MSLYYGIFLTELQIIKAVPIYTIGDFMKFTNYRQVSSFPVLSKVFDNIVYSLLLIFIF